MRVLLFCVLIAYASIVSIFGVDASPSVVVFGDPRVQHAFVGRFSPTKTDLVGINGHVSMSIQRGSLHFEGRNAIVAVLQGNKLRYLSCFEDPAIEQSFEYRLEFSPQVLCVTLPGQIVINGTVLVFLSNGTTPDAQPKLPQVKDLLKFSKKGAVRIEEEDGFGFATVTVDDFMDYFSRMLLEDDIGKPRISIPQSQLQMLPLSTQRGHQSGVWSRIENSQVTFCSQDDPDKCDLSLELGDGSQAYVMAFNGARAYFLRHGHLNGSRSLRVQRLAQSSYTSLYDLLPDTVVALVVPLSETVFFNSTELLVRLASIKSPEDFTTRAPLILSMIDSPDIAIYLTYITTTTITKEKVN